MFRILVFAIIFLAFSACAQAKEQTIIPIDFNGKWQNTLGSELHFFVKNGQVIGTYNTNVGEPDRSKSFPLRGQSQGDQIVFTVNFKKYGSMTAWVGQVTQDQNGTPYLRTMWHNTKDIKDTEEAENIWGSIRTGASEFRRVKRP
ncbi:MAG: hypothetical protein JKX72_04240 [Robiginitomaculum sp.]|nr:hypothetical protein [Robiginitomaculum sp.]